MIRSIYFLMILFACTSSTQKGTEVIDAAKLIELQEEGITIVDIRTKKEYDRGHIPGVVHVDFFAADFTDRMSQYDVNKPVVIHCAVGGRSAKASQKLQKAGFTMIYDYSGGFADWKSKGLDVEY